MMMNYYEVIVPTTNISRSDWEDLQYVAVHKFGCDGVEEFSLDEKSVDALLGERAFGVGDVPGELYTEIEERFLEEVPASMKFYFSANNPQEKAGGFCNFLTHNKLQFELLEKREEDWNQTWKEFYDIVEVSKNLSIVPAWKKDTANIAKSVFINPGMGFGTGDHATTYLCLKLFDEVSFALKNPETVLDFGAGSGILGIAAKLYGAGKVDLYDIDPRAMENAKDNIRLNGTAPEIYRTLLPSDRALIEQQYDLVFANILLHVLLEERDAIMSYVRPGGDLILSGLLTHQLREVQTAYDAKGNGAFILKKLLEKGDWGALWLQKQS